MTYKILGVLLAGAIVLSAAPARAANKEHQQLMADLRILQEQSQQLQNMLGTLNDAIKAVNTRLDQQTETTRKAFADQKLVIDNLTNDVRVIREKLDDNNVRIGSLTQEVDSLRQTLQQVSRPSATLEPDAGAAGSATPPAVGAPPPVPAVGVSPAKLFESAQSDYWAGSYELAIAGFTDYIKSFPKSDMADDAQVLICNAYLTDGKYDKAVEACDVAIRTYPNGDKIPEAYYRKGVALQALKNLDGARDAYERAIKGDPSGENGTIGRLAKQGLDRLRRP
ncbi:MAG TPA: tetratricopeptide repeat protein [Vicinamibacterales bacterium]|nr:tetratricopeptide repeat protein [Vicinamibacterales bacterium]